MSFRRLFVSCASVSAFLGLAIVAVLATAGCSRGASSHAPAQASAAAASATPIALDTSGVDLLTAFKAAFDGPAPAVVSVPENAEDQAHILQFNPAQLFQLSPGLFVLISNGVDPRGCHACGGTLAVHYLKRTTDGFDLLSRSGAIGPESGWGKPPQFTVRTDLFEFPTLQVEASYGGQGCTGTVARLYELTPGGLVGHGSEIALAGSNEGTGKTNFFEYSGSIAPDTGIISNTAYDGTAVPPHLVHAFKVIYKGAVTGEAHYNAEGQQLQQLTLPSC